MIMRTTAVQWLRKQTWDPETHTRAEDGEGLSLDFTFQTPIAGAETDNFNTMVGTGEYTDIMDPGSLFQQQGEPGRGRSASGHHGICGKIYAGLCGAFGCASGMEGAGNLKG